MVNEGKTNCATASAGMDNKAPLIPSYGYGGIEAVTPLPQVFGQVIKMTELTLNAEAASILLFRNSDQELYFEAATGPVGRTLRQVKLNTQYGIAGQVARTGKPLIVNDVARSKNL